MSTHDKDKHPTPPSYPTHGKAPEKSEHHDEKAAKPAPAAETPPSDRASNADVAQPSGQPKKDPIADKRA